VSTRCNTPRYLIWSAPSKTKLYDPCIPAAEHLADVLKTSAQPNVLLRVPKSTVVNRIYGHRAIVAPTIRPGFGAGTVYYGSLRHKLPVAWVTSGLTRDGEPTAMSPSLSMARLPIHRELLSGE
jgi:hypothetical protein